MSDQDKQSTLDYFKKGFQKSTEKWEQENKGKETTLDLVEKLPESEKEKLSLTTLMSLGFKQMTEKKNNEDDKELKGEERE